MRTAWLRLGIGMLAVALGALACRGNDPSGDPKTPPNSPIPDIERPEEPKVPSVPNPLTDGGGAARGPATTPGAQGPR